MLIEHHDMLRAIVREDGRQQILIEVPRYKIEHRDLSSADPASARADVEAMIDKAIDTFGPRQTSAGVEMSRVEPFALRHCQLNAPSASSTTMERRG